MTGGTGRVSIFFSQENVGNRRILAYFKPALHEIARRGNGETRSAI